MQHGSDVLGVSGEHLHLGGHVPRDRGTLESQFGSNKAVTSCTIGLSSQFCENSQLRAKLADVAEVNWVSVLHRRGSIAASKLVSILRSSLIEATVAKV